MLELFLVRDKKGNVKSILKILLPIKFFERVARNQRTFNIKPRFNLRGFRRLAIFLFFLLLLGLQPNVPLVHKPALVLADNSIPEVKDSITAQEIPVMSLPFDGYLSNPFSSWHPGIDIAASLETQIHPVADGVVSQVYFDALGYGHYVIISHTDSVESLYGHMDKIFVTPGQKVTTNDVLGTVGLTGFTSGPHTHLEIHQNGRPINPLPLLPKIQDFPSAQYLNLPIGGATPVQTPPPTPTPDLHKILKPVF